MGLEEEIEGTRQELNKLNKKWDDNKPLTRSEWKKAIVIAMVIMSIGLTWEHVTLTKCFLTPAQTGWNRNACGVIYPGYEKARTQSEENLTKFQKVIQDSQKNTQRIDEIERKSGQ